MCSSALWTRRNAQNWKFLLVDDADVKGRLQPIYRDCMDMLAASLGSPPTGGEQHEGNDHWRYRVFGWPLPRNSTRSDASTVSTLRCSTWLATCWMWTASTLPWRAPTQCVHSAAFTTLDPAEMPKCLEVNEPGTRNVVGAALAQGCDPVVHMSSMRSSRRLATCWIPTVDPVHSSDLPYAKSKADSEIYARSLQAEGKPVITLYPAGVSGPTDAGFNILSMMLAGSLAEDFLMTADTGGWSLVDVRDLAQATVAVLQPGQGPKRYMCGGNTVDWATFNDALTAVTGKERASFPVSREQLLETIDEEAVDIMLGIRPGNDAPFRVQWRRGRDLRDTNCLALRRVFAARRWTDGSRRIGAEAKLLEKVLY
ncbi:hypothetical protein GQR58_030571 [Nymphon striatum]|nr:hypothetical protein GQR58_030571 [Nymphon striatum]